MKAAEAPNPAEDTEGHLSLGPNRLNAIRLILEKAIPESLELMRNHLLWCGEIKYSNLTDDIFLLPFIWPGSVAPADFIPSEVERSQGCPATHSVPTSFNMCRSTTSGAWRRSSTS